jgi:hypothetical protein
LPLTIILGEELSLPILTSEIVLRRIFARDELDALKAKEVKRRDALALNSVLESPARRDLYRLEAKLEFINQEGRKCQLPAAVQEKSVFDALGGAMNGIEGVLLAWDRHGEVNLHGNAVTCIWVSDHGPGTATPSQYVERLMEALSTCGDIPVVGGCFSSIRIKSGLPSMFRVAPVEESPQVTLQEVASSIEKYLFDSGPAFLPACTVDGHEIVYSVISSTMCSWPEGTFNADFGPTGLIDRDDDGYFPDCIRIDVRDICAKAPQTLVLQALQELDNRNQIVFCGPAERPERRAVFKICHIFEDIYTYEVVEDSENTSILCNDSAPTRTVPASQLSTARNNAVTVEPGRGDVAENASTELVWLV